MTSLVIGTAGHVDHGKTALVRALAGADLDQGALDRLKDEQRRGITIDLGFAHTRVGDVDIAFVDVPGHERFVRNMLAGAGGFDAVLLVIAADESIKPQTREHCEICRLLGVSRGVIALSKADLVDGDALALVTLEVRDFVARTFLAEAPIVPVSVQTGTGLDALRHELARLAAAGPRVDERGTVRLAVDRAFSVKGFGTVVTGTLVSGTIQDGDELEVLPERRRVRVRGVHVHKRSVSRAIAPRRVALNLGGHVASDEVSRGATLASPATLAVTRRLDVEVELLRSAPIVRHGSRVRFHLGTSEVGARVAVCATCPGTAGTKEWRAARVGEASVAVQPGGAAYARLRLDEPVVATRGDRFVLRAGSPVTTIGGGLVLDPEPQGRGLRRLGTLARFEALGAAAAPTAFLVDAGARGLSADDLVRRGGLGRAAADATLAAWSAQGLGVHVGGRLFDAASLNAGEERLLSELGTAHEAAPREAGVARETLRERLAPRVPSSWFDLVVSRLTSRRLVVGGERLALVGHQAQIGPAEERGREAIEDALRRGGLTPPDISALPASLGLTPTMVEQAVRALLGERRLVRVGDLVFHAAPLGTLKSAIGAQAEAARSSGRPARLDVAEFKRQHGLTRKHAIPLLEWLDRERVTRRVGESRILL